MTRDKLRKSISNSLSAISKLFDNKNKSYGGNGEDGFYNFTKGAELIFGEATYETKARILLAYASKHVVTLMRPNAIHNDAEFKSRCDDLANYFLILKAMREEVDEIKAEEPKKKPPLGPLLDMRAPYPINLGKPDVAKIHGFDWGKSPLTYAFDFSREMQEIRKALEEKAKPKGVWVSKCNDPLCMKLKSLFGKAGEAAFCVSDCPYIIKEDKKNG